MTTKILQMGPSVHYVIITSSHTSSTYYYDKNILLFIKKKLSLVLINYRENFVMSVSFK